jgi:HEAT repeat protein
MRGPASLVWVLLVGGLMLGFMALFATRMHYGPGGGPEQGLQQFQGVRDLDAQAMSHLADLGLRFHERDNREPTLSLDNPTDSDFAFLESILSSNDQKAKVSAAKALGNIGAPRSVGPLIDSIRGLDANGEDLFLMKQALMIAESLPIEARRAVLIPPWDAHEAELAPNLREGLRLGLRDAGAFDPQFLREAAVSNRDPVVRAFAVKALGAEKHPPMGVLAAALGDPDDSVRSRATQTFGALHPSPLH